MVLDDHVCAICGEAETMDPRDRPEDDDLELCSAFEA